jgi:hypothetical protein
MGKIIHSFAELQAECQEKMRRAMSEAESKTYLNANENLIEFYSQGSPVVYKRTGQLGNSAMTTGVQGGGNHLHAEIYLNPMYEYNTGTYTAAKVIAEAEVGGSGILGKSGFWRKTEMDAKRNVDNAFCKEFGH